LISKFRADLGLLSVTFFWGTTFIISKIILLEVPLLVYLFLRLSIAAVAMDLFALRFIKELDKKTIRHGALLGMFLYIGYLTQMWGIQYTSASNAGFITGLSVAMVPAFGFLFFRIKPSPTALMGVVLAFSGLFLLTGANPLLWNKGDLLVLICAVSVTFHVIFTGIFAPKDNVYLLTAVQLTVVALFTIPVLPFADYNWPQISLINISVLVYLGLIGTVFTFLMQTAMQRYTTTTRTAVIFAMEPVFAALFAYLIAGEMLTLSGWAGGILIILGMVSAEIPSAFFQKYKKTDGNK